MNEEMNANGSVSTSEEEAAPKENVSVNTAEQQQEPVQPKETEQPKAPAAKTNVMACIAFCPALFFVPFLTGDTSKNEVARNSMNQGFLSLLVLICINLLNAVVGLFPYGIAKVGNIVITVLSLAMLVLIIVGMVRSYNDKIFKLPLIGHIDIFKKIKGED